VGPEVIEAFESEFSTSGKLFSATAGGHALVDLHLANREQLLAAGIPEKNISVAPYCTMERTDLFFSYRNEKQRLGKTGRLMSVIGRKS
jgi:copper oxidase (laccase) domain-containing protein